MNKTLLLSLSVLSTLCQASQMQHQGRQMQTLLMNNARQACTQKQRNNYAGLPGVALAQTGPLIGHTGKYFAVTQGDCSRRVTSDCMDNTVRNLNANNLCKFLEKGSLRATQMSDGNYMLRAHVDGKGGGVLGFWGGFFTGKFLTHFVCHGAIAIVSSFAGPAAPVVFGSLEATFMLPIGVAANTVGATTGMAMAVATGPV
jgi:hypothetical protein